MSIQNMPSETEIKIQMPEETTKRVRLRALEVSDVELLYAVENDSSHWAVTDTVAPYSRDLLLQYALSYSADPFSEGQLRLVIEDVEEGEPIGIFDLFEVSMLHRRAIIGIYILPTWRGRGLAVESVKAGMNYCRHILGLKNLLAHILVGEEISFSVFRRCGFMHAGTLKNWHRERDVMLLQKTL